MPRPQRSAAPGDPLSPHIDRARTPLPTLEHGAGGTRDGAAMEGLAASCTVSGIRDAEASKGTLER